MLESKFKSNLRPSGIISFQKNLPIRTGSRCATRLGLSHQPVGPSFTKVTSEQLRFPKVLSDVGCA